MVAAQAHALYETAAALERAEASARVLSARARASRSGTAHAAAFAALAQTGPEGLVPAPGSGGPLLARHLERAAQAGAAAGPALPREVVEALGQAAIEARRQAGGSRALDPQGVARAARREVAAVRGLTAHTMSRDAAWELMRLGTFLPRAAWVAALLSASAEIAGAPGGGGAWGAAAAVTGAERAMGGAPSADSGGFLLLDVAFPLSVAFALAEVEAALHVLARTGSGYSVALALTRVAHTRLRHPDAADSMRREPSVLLDEALDAIGAIARACPAAAGEAAEQTPQPALAETA